VRRQEGLGLYGAPYGGVAVFSGSVVRGEERLIEAAVGSLILKASKLFRLLISHLKRLVNVGGVGSCLMCVWSCRFGIRFTCVEVGCGGAGVESVSSGGFG
ncbi:unnamed protein product, partial [Brassica oleracea var. botrytis]